MLDRARVELLRAGTEALGRLAPALPPAAAALLEALHAELPNPELATTPPDAMAAAAASLFDLAAIRPAGVARVRVLPPGPGRGAVGIAEIVTDDMPFLVDSVLAALTRRGRVVRQLLHPVLAIARDSTGRLTGLGTPGAPRESLIRVAIAAAAGGPLPGADPIAADWPAVETALVRAMADVRLAVDDHAAMRDLLDAAQAELGGTDAAAFLRWMAEDNFVLLGHRRLAVDAHGAVTVARDEDLGLLRDPDAPVFDLLRDLGALPPALVQELADPPALSLAKANMRATVHRPQHADVVTTRAPGGVRLFMGLFAAGAYNRNPRAIPWLAAKVERILVAAGFTAEGHDGRALRNILDTWPRDELLQASEAEILDGALRALDLTIRPRAALVVRRHRYGRFVSAIAWLPRESFDTSLRERVGAMLARAFDGRPSAFYIALGDAPLARVQYIVATDPARPANPDLGLLEAAIAQAARSFAERLAEALAVERGEAQAAAVLRRWRDAFPPAYCDAVGGALAAADLALAERALETGRAAATLERPPGGAGLVLRLAQPGGPLPLADALPLFESLDLRAIEEVPYRLTPAEAPPVVLHVFQLHPGAPVGPERFPQLLAALDALLAGSAEADGFNRLVLRAGLDWRDCWLLRAMFRWLKQVGFGFAQASVEAALANRPAAARCLCDLFHARFDPDAQGDTAAALEAEWTRLLEAVENPDEDRILARLRAVLDAMLRTNFFQGHDRLAFKIDSEAAGEMPSPRPWREVFVHSPRMEGVHLRAGPVARGGIRWSDRREDYRTEILGLMKAQRVKNVVIVPTGAKGGFILKHPPPATDRAALQAEGVACYRVLIEGLLDLADTIGADGVVPPARVVRRDGDDPYLVVAADKGTATFSDVANGLSAAYGFWLDDAFASGGSAGYDHKAMGITARGAWVMVARHFAELGLDIHRDAFTCAGVGDMSGDVFGNGLLVSAQTRLVAAFDHRHIFLDPDPDPVRAFAERTRLFALPRSAWSDYDPAALSAGGGVFPRSAKSIALSPQAQRLLGLGDARVEPAAVLRAILRAPVDLLYFGGIGTYVKAASESHAEAGDRANDMIRVDGRELRARVVGEGANLAITQAGRVDYARHGAGGRGGRVNTDALDNAAGVSTSDHEVNIKILLAEAERAGALTRRQRDELLREMTDEVAALVLRDNHLQSLAVSLEEQAGADALPAQAALMARLERAGVLDRAVAGLPEARALAARQAAGEALTRPEIAALLPFVKLFLTDALATGTLVDDAAFAPLLAAYFPAPLQTRFPGLIGTHRLRRDLIATALANQVANRLGCAGLAPLLEAGTEPALAAAFVVDAAFGLEAAFDAADEAPAPAAMRLAVQAALRRLAVEAAAALLAEPPAPGGPSGALATFAPGIAALVAAMPAEPAQAWIAAGIPAGVATLAAAAPRLAAAPLVLGLAAASGTAPAATAAAWDAVGREHAIDALADAARAAAAPGAFGAPARAALLGDLRAAQRALAAGRLAGRRPEPGRSAAALALARDAAMDGTLPALSVAVRALAGLG